MQETQVLFLGQEDSMEKEMATHSSILALKNPTDFYRCSGEQSSESHLIAHIINHSWTSQATRGRANEKMPLRSRCRSRALRPSCSIRGN